MLRLIEPLRRRVALMLTRAVVNVVNDALKLQGVQVGMGDGEARDYERIMQYGFTGVPLAGAEAVVVCIDGNRDHGVVIAVDDKRYRLKGLAGGEVAMYTDQGDKIHIKRGGTILVEASTKIELSAPSVEIGDGSTFKALVNNSIFDSFNAHVHTCASPGSPTSGPVSTAVPPGAIVWSDLLNATTKTKAA
jgi:phage baseplate assembly protein V